jgi:pimeloyl-ACP methyl ester carboxylesterase
VLVRAPRRTVPARVDFEADAVELAAALGNEPRHVVGHSYGGVTAMHLAAARPGATLSPALLEPAAMSVARGVPAVEEHVETIERGASCSRRQPAVSRLSASRSTLLGHRSRPAIPPEEKPP